MELSKEVYHLIVKYVGQKSDLCNIARVNKQFQAAAERALYNTLYMNGIAATISLCDLLSTRDRLSINVEALTVYAPGKDGALPEQYWIALAGALQRIGRLRYLNLHIEGDNKRSWILRDCPFRLHAFHCDLAWDDDLIAFLNTQHNLTDLYLADYNADHTRPNSTMTLDPRALPKLSTLECSFTDAVRVLAPGRPLVRLKTCFSRDEIESKREELLQLMASLRQVKGRVLCLDLADASYSEDFTLIVLDEIFQRLPGLRYLATVVLPIGREVRIFLRINAVYSLSLSLFFSSLRSILLPPFASPEN